MIFKKYKTLSANGKYAAIKIAPSMPKGNPGKKRAKREKPTHEAVVKRNKRALTMRLWGLIVSNFEEYDNFISLTYENGHVPESEEASKDNFRKFKRKLQRKAKQKGIQLRMIWVTESKSGRPHHHLIINREVPTELIFEIWHEVKGGKIIRVTLMRQDAGKSPDFYDLASYMVKEKTTEYNIIQDLNQKAYSRTRNLVLPETREENVKRQEIRVPKGWELVPGSVEEYIDCITGLPYLEYRLMATEPNANKRQKRGRKVPISKVYDLKRLYIEEQLSLL